MLNAAVFFPRPTVGSNTSGGNQWQYFTGSFIATSTSDVFSLWGTGTDNVDLPSAERHGVTVTNTPGVPAFSIAEHALALMLAVARRIPRNDAKVRQGRWPRLAFPSR